MFRVFPTGTNVAPGCAENVWGSSAAVHSGTVVVSGQQLSWPHIASNRYPGRPLRRAMRTQAWSKFVLGQPLSRGLVCLCRPLVTKEGVLPRRGFFHLATQSIAWPNEITLASPLWTRVYVFPRSCLRRGGFSADAVVFGHRAVWSPFWTRVYVFPRSCPWRCGSLNCKWISKGFANGRAVVDYM